LPRLQKLRLERGALPPGRDGVDHRRQTQPQGVGSESTARHHARRRLIFQKLVQRFDQTGFLSMPLQQPLGIEVKAVRDYREVPGRHAVLKQHALPPPPRLRNRAELSFNDSLIRALTAKPMKPCGPALTAKSRPAIGRKRVCWLSGD